MGWKFFVERQLSANRLEVYGQLELPDGRVKEVTPLVLTDMGEGFNVQPMLQALVDTCWEAGIKPTGHDDFRRANDAQGKHLSDMRVLVGKLADVNLA